MLLLRVPTADKRSRRASSQQTPSCSVKRSSHRLAFPPELAGKRPRCCRRLLILPAGAPGSIPAVCRCRPVPRGSTAPGAGRARCLPLLGGGAGGGYSRAGNAYLHPPAKSAVRRRRRRRGAGAKLEAGARYLFPHANEPVPRLLAQVLPGFCFISLSIGFGKGNPKLPGSSVPYGKSAVF